MYCFDLMPETVVSIDQWNSTRTEYYTEYKYLHNPTNLLVSLTAAVLTSLEHWPLTLDEFTGVMLTAVYDGCVYVERPFSVGDADEIHEWLPEFVGQASGLPDESVAPLAYQWVQDSMCDFLSDDDIDEADRFR